MTTPDVSVLTPSYAYGRFIKDAILSVLHQDGISVEHIVQDGLSSDETIDVLKEFDDSIAWVSESDRGQSDALNKALSRASGRWIAWLNADEFYLPGSLAALVEHAERTGADVAYSDCIFVNQEGQIERLLPNHRFSARVLRDYGCFIASASTIFRRSVLGDDPWDPTLKMIMDLDLYLRLLSRGARFTGLSHPTAAFRRHGERVTAQPSHVFAAEYETVFERYDYRPRRRRGKSWHRFHKLTSGAYVRQTRARLLRGSDLRWFAGNPGLETYKELLSKCY